MRLALTGRQHALGEREDPVRLGDSALRSPTCRAVRREYATLDFRKARRTLGDPLSAGGKEAVTDSPFPEAVELDRKVVLDLFEEIADLDPEALLEEGCRTGCSTNLY